MSERANKKTGASRRILAIALLTLAALLLIASVSGYILRGTEASAANLARMRTSAVLHASTEGLIENIAQQARAQRLSELRADKDFRRRGLDEVNAICDEARDEARAEAEKKYANPVVEDEAALESAIGTFETALAASGTMDQSERAQYGELYVSVVEGVSDWTDLAGEGVSDDQVFQALCEIEPKLDDEGNAHLRDSFIRLARDMAQAENKKETAELVSQLISQMKADVSDWAALDGLSDDELWLSLTEEVPELKDNEAYRAELLAAAKGFASTVANGESLPEDAAAEEGAEVFMETQVDYNYFVPTEALAAEQANNAEAYEALKAQLIAIIPDLGDLPDKLQDTLRRNVESVVWPGSLDFSARYSAYAAHNASPVLQGSAAFTMRLASMAEVLLLGCVALLLLGLVLLCWKPLTERFGVPRTIIALFFILLCLLAELYNISVPMMLGNVLERMTMYGILVLAMMPGIQCGIGLNMGMTIGCISGLLGIVMSLQFNMTGFPAMIFAILVGILVSIPLGWAYSKLLNRMKGNEMTISTYVGFSFVSLMCIAWMLLPFDNPRIIWLLSGHGLRVTHSLLGSFAHKLDELLAFEVIGIKVPTGGLLFLVFTCFLVWLFSRSRTGIAMTAVGSNPRFAEASGINVNRMRTVGTTLSTVIAAVGIVIYSQAFGYAQLYTAPRQLGFIAASAILIGGATVRKARVSHVLVGVFLFEGVLVFGQQIANAVVAGGGLSEVMRIMISNGIILYALTQSGGGSRD